MTEKDVKTTIELPPAVHKQVKVYAAYRGISTAKAMAELVGKVVRQEVEKLQEATSQ